MVDDTTLDKPYARKIEMVTWHWSGKHHRVVQGINLVSLLWTEGTARIPCDFRVYDKPVGGKTKNEHLRDMVTAAHTRGLQPEYVLCDSWYSSLDNLKHLRQLGWAWLTRLKSNRQVNPDRSGNVAIRDLKIPGLTKGSVYTPAVPNGIPHAEDTNQMPPWRLCTQEIIHSVGGFSMLRFCNCVEPGTVP